MKILVIENESDVSTIITGDSHDLKMHRSHSQVWNVSCRGELVGKLKDTGNGVNIAIGKKKVKLDYSEFCKLLDLCEAKMIADPNLREPMNYYKVENDGE